MTKPPTGPGVRGPRSSLLMRVFAKVAAAGARRKEGAPTELAAARTGMQSWSSRTRPARGVHLTSGTVGGVPVVRASSGGAARGTVLYLHGGAYVMGSARDVVHATHLAAHDGPDLLSVEYRLAPEHPHPAGLDDAVAVYQALLTEVGPQRLVVVGESAGGGLALALLQRAREAGLAMPAALVAVYPWADLSLSGASATANAGRDMLIRSQLVEQASWYAAGQDLREPGLSPLFGTFAGFPRTYIAVGQRDLLLDDARRLAERMHAEDVAVVLDEWPGTVHGFTALPLAEGRRCRQRIRAFVDTALPGAAADRDA